MRLKRQLRILTGNTEGVAASATVKVAFATSDRKHVDQHFGAAQSLVVYAIGLERATLLEVVEFETGSQDGHEAKLAAKLLALEGCVAVYCHAVRGSAIRHLLRRGIQPIRVKEGAAIDPLLKELEQDALGYFLLVGQDSSASRVIFCRPLRFDGGGGLERVKGAR
jgi:nitrogen fixation protein NifX